MSETLNDSPAARATQKPKRGRSPGYPGIDLEAAVERAQELWRAQRDNYANIGTVLHHWNYGPSSGAGLVTIAALKKFGFVEDEGSGATRRVRLTPLARAIVTDDRPDSTERTDRLKQAALLPAIHREVWNRYSGLLPPEADLRYYLVNEREFTENGARDFVSQFLKTIAYAGLSSDDANLSGDGEDIPPLQEGIVTPPAPVQTPPADPPKDLPTAQGQRPAPIQFPVGKATVTVHVSEALNAAAWKRMVKLLEAMEPEETT
jgi:hypothetical protein